MSFLSRILAAVWKGSVTHSSRDSWKGLGDHQSSTPGPYHLFPHCGWGLSELPADLSVQVLPNPLQSKGIPTIANYFKQRHSQNVYHLNWARSWDFCRSGAAVVTNSWGAPFHSPHSNHDSLGKHRLCLQLQTPPTGNYFRKWRESSQGKRKSNVVVRGFSEMKK